MRFIHDKKIRNSIIKLFTFTEQIILLKSFALVKNETPDDFTAWIKWLAYENMASVKRVTLFFIIIAITLYITTSKSYWFNYLFFIYLSVSFWIILNQAKNIGYSYSIGIKLFLFALINRIFFEPRSEHNSSTTAVIIPKLTCYLIINKLRNRIISSCSTGIFPIEKNKYGCSTSTTAVIPIVP
ncbi:hypothetical protein Xvie_02709 [Xenorhabdus vietnamensis]|uniref:Uncharacterized protein n=1 Tax=Xenorhabdus vietnamensis TaxID=351656 RepID=A0A1Y2SCD6_9GAMM|nr:hypothetical protein Xvie_02709 [Xenorhabdus vietnamensis]